MPGENDLEAEALYSSINKENSNSAMRAFFFLNQP